MSAMRLQHVTGFKKNNSTMHVRDMHDLCKSMSKTCADRVYVGTHPLDLRSRRAVARPGRCRAAVAVAGLFVADLDARRFRVAEEPCSFGT